MDIVFISERWCFVADRSAKSIKPGLAQLAEWCNADYSWKALDNFEMKFEFCPTLNEKPKAWQQFSFGFVQATYFGVFFSYMVKTTHSTWLFSVVF